MVFVFTRKRTSNLCELLDKLLDTGIDTAHRSS